MQEIAKSIASEWEQAMRPAKDGAVRDFVAVGDVNIKVIGADNNIIDTEIPVRQMLEQIVAKMGIPPFLLGLSWSTTERMSKQQCKILTSEIQSYRRNLTPIINKIIKTWLRTKGVDMNFNVCWEEINLQDEMAQARAKLMLNQAKRLETEI